MFNIKSGSSSIIAIILMFLIISVAAIGFVLLVAQSNNQTALVNNDPTNLSGITYTSEIYNGTNTTLHGLSNVMPNFIWIIILFVLMSVFVIIASMFGRRG